MTLEEILTNVRCPHSWDVNTAESCVDCRTVVMRTLDVMGFTLLRGRESGRGRTRPPADSTPPPFPYSSR